MAEQQFIPQLPEENQPIQAAEQQITEPEQIRAIPSMSMDENVFKRMDDGTTSSLQEIGKDEKVDDSLKQMATNYSQVKAIENMNAVMPVVEEEVFFDNNGDEVKSLTDAQVANFANTELPDPPTEAERKAAIQAIQKDYDKRLEDLNTEVDGLISSGKLKENRRQKYIDKNKKDIDKEFSKRYEKEYFRIVKMGNDNKVAASANSNLNSMEKNIAKISRLLDKNGVSDLVSVDDILNNYVKPESQQAYKSLVGQGITTLPQFRQAFFDGRIEKGKAIFLAYRTGDASSSSFTDNAFIKFSKPVYVEGVEDADGNKSIKVLGEAFVHPVTKEIVGSVNMPISLSTVRINSKYSWANGYNVLQDPLATEEQKASMRQRIDNGIKENMSAFDNLMQKGKFSDAVKVSLIASTFPDKFEEYYEQYIADESKTKDFVGTILKGALGGFALESVSYVIGKGADVLDAATQALLGNEDYKARMGSLAMEIKDNPKLAKYIDKVISNSGGKSGSYLNSIQGISELVGAAKVLMRNDDISFISDMAGKIMPQYMEFMNSFKQFDSSITSRSLNYQNDIRGMLNDSGYTSAVNNAQSLYNNIVNNEDPDRRDAYKFVAIKQKLINKKIEITDTSKLSEVLTPEEINFINTRGAELNSSSPDLINSVVEDVNKFVSAYNEIEKLFPKQAIIAYESKNRPILEKQISDFRRLKTAFENSAISTEAHKIFGRLNLGYQEMQDARGMSSDSFPMLYDSPIKKIQPILYGPQGAVMSFGIGVLDQVSRFLRGISRTTDISSDIMGLDYDSQRIAVQASVEDYTRSIETRQEDTGNYAVDIAKNIGSGLVSMAAFAGAVASGGYLAGGVTFLGSTMGGEAMIEGAQAGLNPFEQLMFASLKVGIELGSEMITPEAGLIGGRAAKSVLTKDMLKRIMNKSTRREGLKEYARLMYNGSKNISKQSILESFEEEVADKGEFVLKSVFNALTTSTFNPTVFTLSESIDNVVTMFGTTLLFKGGSKLLAKKDESGKLVSQIQEQTGMSKEDAVLTAAVTTANGLDSALQLVSQVEENKIPLESLNLPLYDKLKNTIIPGALKFHSQMFEMASSPNISIQQRAVAMTNLIEADRVSEAIQNEEISAEAGQAAINQYNENAQKALKDTEYANQQFGMDNSGIAKMLTQAFGLADMGKDSSGMLDASVSVSQQQQAAEGQVTTEAAPAVTTAEAAPVTEAVATEQVVEAAPATTPVTPATTTEAAAPVTETTAPVATPAVQTATPMATPVAEAEFDTITPDILAEKLTEIVSTGIKKSSVRNFTQRKIAANPEKELVFQMYNTRAALDLAREQYNEVVQSGMPAAAQLTNVRLLEDRLAKLEGLKLNYSKTKQYATQIIEGLKQEGFEQSNIGQYQGAESGQLEEGQRERRERQTAQSATNYRNSNFGSQAQAATQEIASIQDKPPILKMYVDSMQPGQEVQLMDEIASQVVIDEPGAVGQFGQQVVDRVKQYIADTGFTTNLPVVREAMVRRAEQNLAQSINDASVVVARQNQSTSKQHKKAVVKLVDRLKQAFPSVKVFMDKKGFNDAIQDPAARELMTKGGIVYGRILNGNVYLNPDFSNYNTPLHEFGHLWLNVAKASATGVYNRGLELIRDSEYMRKMQADPLYSGLTQEELEEEALAMAIGDRGEQLVIDAQKRGFRGWLGRLLEKMAQYVGIFGMSRNELLNLDLDSYLNMVNASLLAGEPITFNKIGIARESLGAGGFMAKMGNDVKNALTSVAQNAFNLAMQKGKGVDTARIEAATALDKFVKEQVQGKTNTADMMAFANNILEGIYAEAKRNDAANKKQQRLFEAMKLPKFQDIIEEANKLAVELKNSGVKASAAHQAVVAKIKSGIEDLFKGKDRPTNISWINAMSLAPSIAADSIMGIFPNVNRSSLVNDEIVAMSSREFIKYTIKKQIGAINDIKGKSKEVVAAVKEAMKDMADRYGGAIPLSQAQTKAIFQEIEDAVFNNSDNYTSVERASNAIETILERAYRSSMIGKSEALIEKLRKRATKANYTFDLLNKIGKLISLKPASWAHSNLTLEDLNILNNSLQSIISGNNSLIDFAIQKANEIVIENQDRVADEYNSIMSKMDRMVKKAGNLDLSDYASIIAFKNARDDVKERKGVLSAFTPEQLAKIQAKFTELELSIPGSKTIEEVIQEKEREVSDTLNQLAMSIHSGLISEDNDLRSKIRNPLLYDRFISLSNMLVKDDGKGGYVNSLNTKEKIALINTLNDVIENGNFNHAAYKEYNKAKKYFLKTDMYDWAVSLAKRRNIIGQQGITGAIVKGFKDFTKVFLDVEGATPSAERIANNFEILRLHAMDVELFNGYDMFDMGLLERDIFAPMASAVDGAVNKTQAKLEKLRGAMIFLADNGSRAMIKKAVGDVSRLYGVKGWTQYAKLTSRLRKGLYPEFYAQISTRMATIIAHQIDHISNLKEGEVATDIILERNILENVENKNQTMYQFYRGGTLSTLSGNHNKLLDAIAYAALTNGGTETLSELTEDQLLSKLDNNQRKAIDLFRTFISENRDLLESSMVIKGSMNALIKNYFPRRVFQEEKIGEDFDTDTYLNSNFETVGINSGQLEARTGNTGRLDLNGSNVLYNNLKSLNMYNELKPYLEYIKAIDEAVKDLNSFEIPENATPEQEDQLKAMRFAAAYAEGIAIAVKNKLNGSVANGEKALNKSYSAIFNVVSATRAFAANLWLISAGRQLGADYPSNIVKTAAALAFANNGKNTQSWRLMSPTRAKFSSETGDYYWDDYVEIAEMTGSPVYRVVSLYADNFTYDYRKTPEQVQRKNRVSSWQDMAVKKQAWMGRFEYAFKKLTGEAFDHQAFREERGSYRAMNTDAVYKASAAADSFVDRQFGLPSIARQSSRLPNPWIFPLNLLGRFIRNVTGSSKFALNFTALKRDNPFAMIFGFLQGYPSVQYSLFKNKTKLAFSDNSGLSFAKRSKLLAEAITETVIPTFMYGLSRSIMAAAYMSLGFVISGATDDEEQKKIIEEEMAKKGFWERQLAKMKLYFKQEENTIFNQLINTIASLTVQPISSYNTRLVYGMLAFRMYKKQMVESLVDKQLTKEQRTEIGKKIKNFEKNLFGWYNIRPIEIYAGKEYEDAVRAYQWASGRATQGWEDIFEMTAGFGEVVKTATSIRSIIDMSGKVDEKDLSKRQYYASIALKAYGLLFSNMILGGKYGWALSMFSGDANKLANMILKDLEDSSRAYDKKQGVKPKMYIIPIYPSEGAGGGGGGGLDSKRRKPGLDGRRGKTKMF